MRDCTEKMWFAQDLEPDEDWQAQLDGYNRSPEEAAQATPILVPMVDADIKHYGERDWIAHDALIEAGYRNLENFDVIRVRNRFYELQAHVGRKLVTGIAGGAWWIEEIVPSEEVRKLFRRKGFTVLSEAAYQELEISRGAELLWPQ